MQTHSITEAQAHLPQLLDAVENGDEIILTRLGCPIARIVQVRQAIKVKTEVRLLSEQNETSNDIDSNIQPDWVVKRLAALQHTRERFGGLLSSSEEFANKKRDEIAIEEKRFVR